MYVSNTAWPFVGAGAALMRFCTEAMDIESPQAAGLHPLQRDGDADRKRLVAEAPVRDNFWASRPGHNIDPVNAATTLRKRRIMAMPMSAMDSGPQPTANWSSQRRQEDPFTACDPL